MSLLNFMNAIGAPVLTGSLSTADFLIKSSAGGNENWCLKFSAFCGLLKIVYLRASLNWSVMFGFGSSSCLSLTSSISSSSSSSSSSASRAVSSSFFCYILSCSVWSVFYISDCESTFDSSTASLLISLCFSIVSWTLPLLLSDPLISCCWLLALFYTLNSVSLLFNSLSLSFFYLLEYYFFCPLTTLELLMSRFLWPVLGVIPPNPFAWFEVITYVFLAFCGLLSSLECPGADYEPLFKLLRLELYLLWPLAFLSDSF